MGDGFFGEKVTMSNGRRREVSKLDTISLV